MDRHVNQDGTVYADKMNEAMTQAVMNWWKGLSKEEILCYIAEQPTITADHLRTMMANSEATLAFDIKFSTSSKVAATDFHVAG